MTTGISRKTFQLTPFANRAAAWAAGLLLLVAFLACLVSPFLAIDQARWPFPGFVVESNLNVSKMMRPEWAGQALGQGGWRVVRVGTTDVHRPADLDAYLRNVPFGTLVEYTLQSRTTPDVFQSIGIPANRIPAWDNVFQSIVIPANRFPPWDMVLFFWGPYFVALAYLVCGLWIYRARREEPAARACTVACAAAALSLGLALDVLWGHHVDWLWILSLPLVGAGILHLGLLFPEPLPLTRRAAWAMGLPYVLAAGLAAWGTVNYVTTGTGPTALAFWQPAGLWISVSSFFEIT